MSSLCVFCTLVHSEESKIYNNMKNLLGVHSEESKIYNNMKILLGVHSEESKIYNMKILLGSQ
jgi:hypothetical protein